MAEFRKRLVRLLGLAAALTLLVAPTSAVAQDQDKAPVTVPALTNWTAEQGSYQYGTKSLYDQSWDPRGFEGEKLASSRGVTGAKISLWPDNGRGETENEVAVGLWPALRHIAQATWGDPRPDATYAGFTARGTAVGHAPRWRDLTRLSVADGRYTFRTAGRSFEVQVTRTADGYASVRTADGCLEVGGGKLTLNVPLQPGVEATGKTCDPARHPAALAVGARVRRLPPGQRDHADGADRDGRRPAGAVPAGPGHLGRLAPDRA